VIFAFYSRRFLRIFPLYYFVLALALRWGVSDSSASAGWHLAYLTNLYCFLVQDWIGSLSHFWSLAVEEQFYLVWPAFVLFAPRHLLGPLFAAIILAAPVFRETVFWLTNNHFVAFLMPACLDTLGIGALLAFLWESRRPEQIRTFCSCCLAAGAVLWLVQLTGYLQATLEIGFLTTTALALIFVWVVHHAARGFGGPVGVVLAARPIVYLGTISYGLYIWHNFAAEFSKRVSGRLGFEFEYPRELGLTQFLFVTAFSVIAASLSWFVLERPLNELKRYFPYSRK